MSNSNISRCVNILSPFFVRISDYADYTEDAEGVAFWAAIFSKHWHIYENWDKSTPFRVFRVLRAFRDSDKMKLSLKPSNNGHRSLKPLEQERSTVSDKTLHTH